MDAAGVPARRRAARADAMVLQDHRIRGRPARALDTLDRWPEKVRLMQANWIGRSEGLLVRFALDAEGKRREATRDRCLHDAAGHAVRREVHGDFARPSAGARSSREHDPALAEFIADCQRRGTSEAAIEMAREEGLRHGASRAASVRSDLAAAGLCRQFRPDGIRHRRDFRLPGARSARPRFRQQIRARQHSGRLPAGCRSATTSPSPIPPMMGRAA